MLESFISDAKSAAESVVAKHAARASVAVPFIVAIGFATTSITLMLVEQFGARNACLILAAGFAAIGLVALLAVRNKEHDEHVLGQKSAKDEPVEVATPASAAVPMEVPLAMIAALMSSPVSPASIASAARTIGRNLPLVVLAASIGFLIWPRPIKSVEPLPQTDDSTGKGSGVMRPNGAYRSDDQHMAA